MDYRERGKALSRCAISPIFEEKIAILTPLIQISHV